MSDFNTFTGKTVDDAISEACRFFATERDKLEVEILSGGSTGIFGLVGKKKAQIRVRRRLDPALTAMIEEEERQAQAAAKAQPRTPAQGSARASGNIAEHPEAIAPRVPRGEARDVQLEKTSLPSGTQPGQNVRNGQEDKHSQSGPLDQNTRSGQGESAQTGRERPPKSLEGRRDRPQKPRDSRPERTRRAESGQTGSEQAKAEPGRQTHNEVRLRPEHLEDDLPEGQDQSPASPELLALADEIMGRLLTPILDQAPKIEIEGTASRVNVIIDDEEHSGLLIGREGQTLAALQYLANRILARRWESPVRVQINTGEYREKQDDNLRKMAAYLADKARNLGRPQSTKPLSSYHRRVIHMALQGDETIQTRSKGDGPMKRVIILPRRPKAEAQPQ